MTSTLRLQCCTVYLPFLSFWRWGGVRLSHRCTITFTLNVRIYDSANFSGRCIGQRVNTEYHVYSDLVPSYLWANGQPEDNSIQQEIICGPRTRAWKWQVLCSFLVESCHRQQWLECDIGYWRSEIMNFVTQIILFYTSKTISLIFGKERSGVNVPGHMHCCSTWYILCHLLI